ncbi:phosphoribosylglycinamide formyltransferase [Leptospira idonii]|uniref:phosphoribosylglycinamide formyltransferase n=1 Tax=Leptospira idonii TaxID=1193500 RepID=UPI001AEFA371|nr:phosphoribosylglycinamide formyltransferase [Leptospira idonii]
MATGFTKKEKRIVFLASGRGSNFENAVKFLKKKKIPALPVALLTDNPKAKSIELARSFQIPVQILNFAEFADKKDFHKALLAQAKELSPDLIVACGYMRILKPEFVQSFPGKIINIHPSLLPSFPGLDSQKQALDYGAKIAGCTVHFVEEGVDTGPIILQKSVEILPHWNEKELSLAILKEEHKILPLAIQLFCENKLKINGRKVEIRK